MRTRSLGPVLGMIAAAALVACVKGAVAPPPPATAPGFARDVEIEGHPATIAARTARALQRFAYTTRRFSSDSTWGYRATDQISVRVRYVTAPFDSTHASIEVWGKCHETGIRCLQNELVTIATAMAADEGPPP
jgi:hypothetical protein